MKKIFFIPLLAISIKATAQKKMSRNSPIIQKGLYLSFNPHSILEPEQGGVGLGIGYRLSERIEIWTELNYLYKGFFQDAGKFDNLKGFRNITSFKYYYNNRLGMFIGAEFRIKNYSFSEKNTFVNVKTHDTLTNFQYTAAHTLACAAVFWGKRLKLTANGKFEMEGNVGIGIKQRRISRKNIPDGYSKLEYRAIDSFSPFNGRDVEDAYPYLPATIRFIYHL
jgi:hypothetical protein